jgi:hypothetical protein
MSLTADQAIDKAVQQQSEWESLKDDLVYFGYTAEQARCMTYERFVAEKPIHGLDFHYALRICGRVVHITWDDWMTDDTIDYYPSDPFLSVVNH